MLQYTNDYVTDLQDVSKAIPNFYELNNKKILITGSTGLIGSSVVDILMQANNDGVFYTDVYAAGRNAEKVATRFVRWNNYPQFHYFPYDAMQKIETEETYDYVIQGASNSSPDLYSKQPVETMLGNLIGINSILELCKIGKCKRVLYISSSEVYGKKSDGEPYDEEDYQYLDILNPRACYPSAKRAAETLCASYKKEYGIDFVIVRPGHIYGPTMTELDCRASSQFPREVKSGNNIVMKSSGEQIRSYCYVLDCASAILTVLLNGKSGEAYNISNPNSIVSIRQMAEAFAYQSGKKVIFENASDEERQAYNLMNNSSLSSKKLENLGWKGLFDMPSGAEKTLNALN